MIIMNTKNQQLHIFIFPFLAQGHIIPIIDMAKLFASRGLRVAIVTTPSNSSLFCNQLIRFNIEIFTIKFPYLEVGLPQGCESLGSVIDSYEMYQKFQKALTMLEAELERLLQQHRPDCLVADFFFPWATDLAARYGIPRIVFSGGSFFSSCVSYSSSMLDMTNIDNLSGSEIITVPNLPDEIRMKRKNLPRFFAESFGQDFANLFKDCEKAEEKSYGIVVNSFRELEPDYVDYCRKAMGRKAWHIGPVSLCNNTDKDKAERGVSVENCIGGGQENLLKWLDSKEHNSVIYVSFGTLGFLKDTQIVEIAMGLEASMQNFIWVVKKEDSTSLPPGFEERIEGRGSIIKDWAPQLLILPHQSVGGFLTHCGWNSVLEAVTCGVPMLTWPLAADQFCNDKLVTDALKIGVGVGGVEEESEDIKSREVIEKTVRMILGSREGEEMRHKARELSQMARKAVGEGGSSYADLTSFIEELRLL